MSYGQASFLSVGISRIDRQHHRIAEIIAKLHNADSRGDTCAVTDTLYELLNQIIEHFAAENAMLQNAGHPLAIHYRRTHEAFIARVNNYALQLEGGQNVIRRLLADLHIWWNGHLQHHQADNALLSKSKGLFSRILRGLYQRK